MASVSVTTARTCSPGAPSSPSTTPSQPWSPSPSSFSSSSSPPLSVTSSSDFPFSSTGTYAPSLTTSSGTWQSATSCSPPPSYPYRSSTNVWATGCSVRRYASSGWSQTCSTAPPRSGICAWSRSTGLTLRCTRCGTARTAPQNKPPSTWYWYGPSRLPSAFLPCSVGTIFRRLTYTTTPPMFTAASCSEYRVTSSTRRVDPSSYPLPSRCHSTSAFSSVLRRRMRRMPMKVPSAKASSGVKNNSVISVSTTVTAISGYKNLQSCPTAGKADRDRFGPVNSKSSQTVEMTGLPTNWNKSGLLTSGWKADEINSSKSFSDLDCDEDDQIQPSHIGVMTKSVTEADFVETVTAQNINGSRNMLGHFQDLNKAFDSESAPITTDDKISNNKDIRENPAEDNNSKRRSKFLNPFRSNKKLRGTFTQQRGFEQRELKATIRMAIIIAFFCGMWIGFFTLYVIQGCCPKSTCFIPRQLDAFFFWLGYSNSSINPILYTIFNDEFRKAFIKILGCTLHRRTAGDPRASSSNSRIT